jgi:hypothetical protein
MRTRHKQAWLPPARDVIAKFTSNDVAGLRRLSARLKVSENRIYHWMYSKEDRGTGGFIPLDHHRAILEFARELGIALTPGELTGLQEFDDPKPDRKPSRKSPRPSGAQSDLTLPLLAAE